MSFVNASVSLTGKSPCMSSAKADFAAISPREFLQATGLTATILQVAFDSAMRCIMTKN